jgi:hypothetical protein
MQNHNLSVSSIRLTGRAGPRLSWLDIGRTDYAGPFLDVVHHEFAKVGGRARSHRIAKFCKAFMRTGRLG